MEDFNVNIIEENRHGQKKDFKFSTLAPDLSEAAILFDMACNRLKDINHWNEYAGGISARFYMTDSLGNPAEGDPVQGFYIKINIPGPGTIAGEGFDWVKIEEVIREESSDRKLFAIKVKPSSNPLSDSKSTAHFLSSDASSYFIVQQDGLMIFSEIYGRNESPNLKAEHIMDKIRNAGVAAGAIIGVANVQWNLLAKGLLQ